MAFWNKLARGRDRPDSSIPTGRASSGTGYLNKSLSPYRSRTADILEQLRLIREESAAIDFLRRVTPDVSMAVWNFIRLANQGHEMAFYDANNQEKRLTQVEADWRTFASRVNEISNSGLDGLIDILHQSAFVKGAQGLEAEVNADRTDIVDVYPIIPQTITWELEERNGRQKWIPYQWHLGTGKVSLEPGKANFYWVPTDPDIDDPRGNLMLSPVLQSIDFQMQIMQDLQAVLHRQGYPRNDIKINTERVWAAMPPAIKASAQKAKEWLNNLWNEIRAAFRNIEPDEDYIHWDETEINMNQGANASRSLDVRAISELVDQQVMSGAKQLSIFMNRNSGVTESWGSIQFLIFCNGIASIQRGSKRIIEEIARLWLRVHGIQAVPVFTHNKIDWNSEEQRMTVKLMEQEFHAIAQLMGWEDGDRAAQEVLGVENAVGLPVDSARVSFSRGGDNHRTDDKLPGGLRQQESIKTGLRSRMGIVK